MGRNKRQPKAVSLTEGAATDLTEGAAMEMHHEEAYRRFRVQGDSDGLGRQPPGREIACLAAD